MSARKQDLFQTEFKIAIRSYKTLILAVIMAASMPGITAQAKDFGTKGHTQQIIEQPFLRMVDDRLQKVDIRKEQEKMTILVKDRVNNPTTINGIETAVTSRDFYFDPTYTLDEDAVLPCGKILHKAGIKVNPLDHMSWNGTLVFIDGRDKWQVAWAVKNYIKTVKIEEDEELKKIGHEQNLVPAGSLNTYNKDDNKIVLVAGRPLELQKEIGSVIYFDQFGELTKKFGIAYVPAIVRQDGKFLKVTEINIRGRE